MCDNFKCYSLNVVHASSIVHSSQVDAGLFHPCFLAFFSDRYFYFQYFQIYTSIIT